MNEPFPVTFGVCSRCGRRGNMNPTNLPYQAENTDETGHGYELKLFRGEWLDHLCIQEILDDEEDLRQAELDREDQRLRSKLGFRTSYED